MSRFPSPSALRQPPTPPHVRRKDANETSWVAVYEAPIPFVTDEKGTVVVMCFETVVDSHHIETGALLERIRDRRWIAALSKR